MCAEPCRRTAGAKWRSSQRGTALIEAVVGLTLMCALGTLTVLLGKYLTAQHATIAASRYLAFECTVRIDECKDLGSNPALVDEIRHRFLAQTQSPIRSGDAIDDTPDVSQRRALWTDQAGRPMLARYSGVGAQVRHPAFDAGEGVATGQARGVANAARLLSELAGPDRFGLDLFGGMADAQVQVPLGTRSANPSGATLGLPNVQLRARTVVLTDAWNASGPYGPRDDSFESRVTRGQRLAEPLELAAELAYAPTRALLALSELGLLEPTASAFRYHEIDVDLVPADRVGQ